MHSSYMLKLEKIVYLRMESVVQSTCHRVRFVRRVRGVTSTSKYLKGMRIHSNLFINPSQSLFLRKPFSEERNRKKRNTFTHNYMNVNGILPLNRARFSQRQTIQLFHLFYFCVINLMVIQEKISTLLKSNTDSKPSIEFRVTQRILRVENHERCVVASLLE